jgi:hypothetical protein
MFLTICLTALFSGIGGLPQRLVSYAAGRISVAVGLDAGFATAQSPFEKI